MLIYHGTVTALGQNVKHINLSKAKNISPNTSCHIPVRFVEKIELTGVDLQGVTITKLVRILTP